VIGFGRPLSDIDWEDAVKKSKVNIEKTLDFGFISYKIWFNTDRVDRPTPLYDDQILVHQQLKLVKLNKHLNSYLGKSDLWEYKNNHGKPDLPYNICEDMISNIQDADDLMYWVFFDVEFVLSLLFTFNIPKERIFFFSDNIAKTNMARSKYVNVNSHLININDILEGNFQMPKTSNIAVIGNPPYHTPSSGNTTDSKNSRNNPLYNKFTMALWDKIKPTYMSFIIPSTWMTAHGLGLPAFREFMFSGVTKSITHFDKTDDVFPSVTIPGGVCYFLLTKENYNSVLINGIEVENDCVDKNNIVVLKKNSIYDKVKMKTESYIDSLHLPNIPFGLKTNHDKSVDGIRCLFSTQHDDICYVDISDVTKNKHIIHKWKVLHKMTGYKLSGSTDFRIPLDYLSSDSVIILEPNTVCTASFGVIYYFDTEDEATNFKKYVLTKFFRYMLSLNVKTYVLTTPHFAWIPDMKDYTKVWTDEMLFKHFNLTEEEIATINEKILN
jgi:hypothetical protein